LTAILRKSWVCKAAAAAALAMVCARADAQSPAVEQNAIPAPPPPVASARPAPPANPAVTPGPAASPLDPTDSVKLRQAIQAAQSGDTNNARSVSTTISDPVARRLALWAMIDAAGTNLSFFDLDSARRELWGWPRQGRRQTVTEKAMESAGLSSQAVVQWFDGKDPETAEGAMALASAYQQLGRQADAQTLIRTVWRNRVFEADPQARMVSRFGAYLTQDDYAARLELLLYGNPGPAVRALMDIVGPDTRALAEARIALRANRNDATDMVGRVPAGLQNHRALSFERARYYRKRNLDVLAAGLVPNFPAAPQTYPAASNQIWVERRALMMSLLHAGDMQGAYAAVTNHGLPYGEDYTEAEFFAGWIALKKLNNPSEAAQHFANIQKAGSSPITLSRALYWRGRAAEAQGDAAGAQGYWFEGARYYTAFYGQLAAERAGQTTITLTRDPVPTYDDRARFEGRDQVRAARMLADAGMRDLFRTFALALDDEVPTAEELGMLVDMARAYGDQDLAMRIVRAGAVRGLYLPERGYPVRAVPPVAGAPEPALVHAIIRQESGFDPAVRSGAGARGMMQLMPGTASGVARKLGMGYSADRLNDPDYNMSLGAAYLGDLVQTFSGSYVMAAAAYNAGPGRPALWATECGDPRGATTDPSDFIECIPFAETRNYVMRIMEATQVYRARMNGGSAPLMAAMDLRRGGYGVNPPPVVYQPIGSAQVASADPFVGVAGGSGPVPYAQLGQRAAVEDRLAEQPRVNVAARDDDERCTTVKVKRRGKTKTETVCKQNGKAKASAGLKNKSKVSKAKADRGHGGPVRRRKAR
jgi:soluble lytic murein transglycosylase